MRPKVFIVFACVLPLSLIVFVAIRAGQVLAYYQTSEFLGNPGGLHLTADQHHQILGRVAAERPNLDVEKLLSRGNMFNNVEWVGFDNRRYRFMARPVLSLYFRFGVDDQTKLEVPMLRTNFRSYPCRENAEAIRNRWEGEGALRTEDAYELLLCCHDVLRRKVWGRFPDPPSAWPP